MRRFTSLLVVVAFAVWMRSDAARAPAFVDRPLAQQNTPPEALAIVVNQSNPVQDLSSAELKRIFLGNRSHWADGKRITLVMREPEDSERKVMIREVCGMTEDQLKTHFIRGLYTGEILSTPKVLDTPAGVRKFLFNVPGAIGYLRISEVDTSVKIVRIDHLLPGDKGYKLHVQYQEGSPVD
jgi:ABC-type phosphate transport system substrate-binding protein